MSKAQTIQLIAQDIKQQFLKDGSGHDWSHIERVWKMARTIAKKEKGANIFLTEIIALTHEVGDYKLEPDLVDRQEAKVTKLLQKHKLDSKDIEYIVHAVCNLSFSKNVEGEKELSLEGQIAQDADRLEALGAIGISRVFAYAGSKGNSIYDPSIKPKLKHTKKSYMHEKNTAINHFYEKLLLLRDRMNTKTGKKIATVRHRFLELYLKEFYAEWEGKK